MKRLCGLQREPTRNKVASLGQVPAPLWASISLPIKWSAQFLWLVKRLRVS